MIIQERRANILGVRSEERGVRSCQLRVKSEELRVAVCRFAAWIRICYEKRHHGATRTLAFPWGKVARSAG